MSGVSESPFDRTIFTDGDRRRQLLGLIGSAYVRLGPGNTFFEHIICDGIRKDNALANCAALSKTCWRKKTAWDQPVVAKAKRVADQHKGIWTPARQVIPGSRRSNWMKHVNGLVERRPGR